MTEKTYKIARITCPYMKTNERTGNMKTFIKTLKKPITWIVSAIVCLIFAIIMWLVKKTKK